MSESQELQALQEKNDVEKNSGEVDRNECSKQIDNVLEDLKFGKWTVLTMSCFICWGLMLPYFSIGGALLNPNVDYWCAEKNLSQFNLSHSEYESLGNLSSTLIWEKTDGVMKKSQCYEYDIMKYLQNLENNNREIPIQKCTSWEYDKSVHYSTVAMEWDLVCDRAVMSPFFQSFFYFGVAIGEPLNGFLSDRYGRRWVMRRIWFVFMISSIVSNVSPYYFLLLAMRVFLGIVHSSQSAAYVLALESCPPKYRTKVGGISITSFAISGISFAGFGYFLRDWRVLQGVCILPALLHLFYLPFFDESPRWLLQNNKINEGINVLKKIARKHNNKNYELNPYFEDLLKNHTEVQTPVKESKSCSHFVKDCLVSMKEEFKESLVLVKTPTLRRISLSMFGCWAVTGLAFWGMSLAGSTFSSDPFLYMAIQCIMEVIGYLWVVPILKCVGRKTLLSFNFFACGTSMLLILLIPRDYMWATFTLAMIGKMFITGVYNILYLYTTELFPTCVRNRGLCISSMMARICSIASPFIISIMVQLYWWAPSVVFGTAAILGSVSALFAPETKGKPLVDTIEQLENLHKKSK